MIALTLAEVAEAVGGSVSGDSASRVTGTVTVDSRTLGSGDLFVALPGERVDGHDFLGAAGAAGAAGALVALSLGSGLGFGWAVALSGAGESRSWTSPPTAVGIAVNAAARLAGADIDVVPALRAVALGLLLVVLVVVWWRFRRGDPIAGAALACLAVIFLAPITQPWYLLWPLALLAVTVVATRWLEVAVIVSMFLILPNGDGAWKPLQVPLAFAVTALTGWVVWRAVRWLREPVPEVVACDPR